MIERTKNGSKRRAFSMGWHCWRRWFTYRKSNVSLVDRRFLPLLFIKYLPLSFSPQPVYPLPSAGSCGFFSCSFGRRNAPCGDDVRTALTDSRCRPRRLRTAAQCGEPRYVSHPAAETIVAITSVPNCFSPIIAPQCGPYFGARVPLQSLFLAVPQVNGVDGISCSRSARCKSRYC